MSGCDRGTTYPPTSIPWELLVVILILEAQYLEVGTVFIISTWCGAVLGGLLNLKSHVINVVKTP